ncbi:hypothetical protein [uncultured Phycicoccus sp.]|uniref:hypothetical protein n=1 Tax=uncultured Phycicoccus sp. TaxID=661422 RepID=UPI002631364F|nr:hypothetical protein [uncultured Phycicoccus sp.]
MGRAQLVWAAAGLLLGAGVAGCGTSLHPVDDGVYGALVPTTAQWADERSTQIPGGFAALRADDVDRVVLRIDGDSVSFELDGQVAATRSIAERRAVRDREGSGPFRAQAEVLALGEEPLVLGSLRISDPVIWYAGGYESTVVVAVKPADPDERGPVVQCVAEDVQCLHLPVGADPVGDPAGRYLDMNQPGTSENPLASIEVTATEIVYALDSGRETRTTRDEESLIRACGLWESAAWPVPAEAGVAFDDPVLVETRCPLPYGESPSLTVMERAAVPVLAPLAPQWAGFWCQPGPDCLWFMDDEAAVD